MDVDWHKPEGASPSRFYFLCVRSRGLPDDAALILAGYLKPRKELSLFLAQ